MRTDAMVLVCIGAALTLTLSGAGAHDIKAEKTEGIPASFDLRSASGALEGPLLVLSMTTAGQVGADTPEPTGKTPGSGVYAYVWPTTLDPAAAGFEPKSGILALAVTAHPDFDDTPKFDENGDSDPANDGKTWHTHWVVLTEDTSCGAAKLKVRDIAPGEDLKTPANHPDLPIMIDSPESTPRLADNQLTVKAEIQPDDSAEAAKFDAVTAALRVNAEGKAPLLCVTQVFDIASGDLSLPGELTRTH